MSAAPSHITHMRLVEKSTSVRETRLHCRHNHSINPLARLLFEDIVELSRDKGYCYAQNDYLADLSGAPTRTIERQLTELDRAGYIDREGRGRGRKIVVSNRWTSIPVPEKKPPSRGGFKTANPGVRADKNPPSDGGNESAVRWRKGATNPPSDGATNPPSDGAIHIDILLTDVERRARVHPPAQAPARGAEEKHDDDDVLDLSFLPRKDERHRPAIEETFRLLGGSRKYETLKARTYGGGLGMNPAMMRAMSATEKRLGFSKLVAACTIAASMNIPLSKIDSVTAQWDKPDPRSIEIFDGVEPWHK